MQIGQVQNVLKYTSLVSKFKT